MLKERPKLKKLPASLAPTIKAYVEARDAKRFADAAARTAEKTLKTTQARIIAAMEGQQTAVCEDHLVVLKRGEPVEAQLTLVDQTKVSWSEVTRVIVGNREIKRADVIGLYGGKAGAVSLMISKRIT